MSALKGIAIAVLVFAGPWGWAMLVLWAIGAAVQKQNSDTKLEKVPVAPSVTPPTDSGGGEDFNSDQANPTGRTLLITEICARFSGQGYYVAEMIPDVKLKNAMKTYPVTGGGRVIALIDATVMGSAVNGMAIGENGISWHNSWETETRQSSLEWIELSKVAIEADSFTIKLGQGNNFGVAGCSFGKGNVIALLKQLQQIEKSKTPSRPHTETPRLDVNSADFDELLTLPGIGAAEARLLLNKRDLGIYPHSTEELSEILNIKPHIACRLKGRIAFSNPKNTPAPPPHAPESPSTPATSSAPSRAGGRTID